MMRGGIRGTIRATLTGLALLLSSSSLHGSPSAPTLTFPHIAAGVGIEMEINLTNPSEQLDTGAILFKDQNGQPLSLPVADGEVVTVVNRIDYAIKPGGVRKVSMSGKGELKVGYALVLSDNLASRLVGNVMVTINRTFDVSIPDSEPATDARLFIEKKWSLDSGVALLNLETQPVTVKLTLRNPEGQEVRQTEVKLEAGQKVSAFLGDLFSDLSKPLGSFVGSLHASADSPFYLLGLRQRNSGSLASLPSAPTAASLGGSQLLYLLDAGLDVRSKDFTKEELESKTVLQLLGIEKAPKSNLLRLTNNNRKQAVTLHFYYLNDEYRDFFDFLVVLPCGQTLTFDPLDFAIPATDLKTSNLLFGTGLDPELAKQFPAAQFGSGRFILSVVAVGAALDDDDVPDILFPNEIAPVGSCGVTPLNTGSEDGLDRFNLHVYNARPMVFDYLSGSQVAAGSGCEGRSLSGDTEMKRASAFTRTLVPAPGAPADSGYFVLLPGSDSGLFELMEKLGAEVCGAPLPATIFITWGSEPLRLLSAREQDDVPGQAGTDTKTWLVTSHPPSKSGRSSSVASLTRDVILL